MSNLELRIDESSDLSFDAVDFVGVPFAPTVEVEDIEGGHRVSITSMGAEGKKTDEFDVMDGADGATWLSGNVLIGELSESTVLTADDAYAAPPKSVGVYGKSVQAGTPTPDAPVAIQSVDNLTLNVCGKNLLPRYSAITVNGITFTVANDGAVTANGTATGTVNLSIPFLVPKTDTYTLSGCPSGGGASSVQLWTLDGATLPDAQITDTGSGGTGTLTYGHTISVKIRIQSGYTCDNVVFRPQLELGTTATDYAPYVGQSVQIPLSNHIARSLPDGTCDTLTLSYIGPSETEGWGVYSAELVQRVWSYTFDGSETVSGTTNNCVYFNVSSLGIPFPPWLPKGAAGLCDRYAVNDNYISTNVPDNSVVIGSSKFSSTNRIVFYDTAHKDTFKAWLAENPVTLDYLIATPITHDLGTVELPILPNPLTAWADGGSAQPNMSMTYEQDINIVISELRSAIADMATS